MEKMYETAQKPERVILVGVNEGGDEKEVRESLDELGELVKTAGAEPVAVLVQNREKIHPGTYIGKGKIEELRNAISLSQATGIVCDDELSPAQLKNLEQELETKVMDRTLISCIQTGRTEKLVVQTGRRNRNKRSGRKETGD